MEPCPPNPDLRTPGHGVGFTQGTQQAGRAGDEQVHNDRRAEVGGADRDSETGRDLCKGVAPSQVHQADQGMLCGGSLQRRSPSRATLSTMTHSTGA